MEYKAYEDCKMLSDEIEDTNDRYICKLNCKIHDLDQSLGHATVPRNANPQEAAASPIPQAPAEAIFVTKSIPNVESYEDCIEICVNGSVSNGAKSAESRRVYIIMCHTSIMCEAGCNRWKQNTPEYIDCVNARTSDGHNDGRAHDRVAPRSNIAHKTTAPTILQAQAEAIIGPLPLANEEDVENGIADCTNTTTGGTHCEIKDQCSKECNAFSDCPKVCDGTAEDSAKSACILDCLERNLNSHPA